MHEYKVTSTKSKEAVNVTAVVARAAEGIGDGLLYLFVPHTTAALIVSEDDEELRDDFAVVAKQWLEDVGPFRHRRNGNPNTSAHVLSAVIGPGLWLPVRDGRLALGTYQNILLLEMDGPKERTILATRFPS